MLKCLITEHGKFRFILTPFVATVLLITAGVTYAQQNCTDDGSGPYGSLLNEDEFNQAVQALPPAAFLTPRVQPPLPSNAYVDNLPAVSQQGTAATPGSPGSCEAQSFGYGLGSYTAARLPGGSHKWIAAVPGNSVSAAFFLGNRHWICTMPRRRSGAAISQPSGGVWRADARTRVPYQPDCSYFSMIPQQRGFPDNYPDMKRFRIGSFATFNIGNDPQAALQRIKEYIANGQAVAFSGFVLCGYGTNLPMQDGVIYETSYIIGANGQPAGHGQLVVGYDDNVGTLGD